MTALQLRHRLFPDMDLLVHNVTNVIIPSQRLQWSLITAIICGHSEM